MKIGFEAQRVFRKAKHGMDIVALELMRRLPVLDPHNDYTLFARNGPDRTWSEGSAASIELLRGLTYADREQISLPAAVLRKKIDLLHCTANTAPLMHTVPMILTLHDIIFLEKNNLQGSAYQNAGNIYRRLVVPAAIRNAAAIVTVSDYEYRIIAARFPAAETKTTVIHHGVDERFHNRYSAEQIKSFRAQYGLPEDYILFLGNTAPKKNSANVLTAYSHYREFARAPIPLVVTDYERTLADRHLARIGKPESGNSIIFSGYIPSAEMPLLYAGSSLFLYPSLRESFGLPILEAMACGVPVITSDAAAMPEVAGGAAILIDPQKPEQIAERIAEVLATAEVREKMIEKGLLRAAHFTWQRSAEMLIALYNQVAGNKRL